MTVDHQDVTDVGETAEEVKGSTGKIDGTDTDDHATPDEPGDSLQEGKPQAPNGSLLKVRVVTIVLAILLFSAAGLASWTYSTQFRPDQQTNPAVAAATIKAASEGTVAILSYSPETLDKDFAAAKSRLTGDFLTYYTQFTQDIVTPAAKQKQVKTSATIIKAAVSELKPGSAVVLVFLNQSTTSKENPDGSFAASSVKVGLTKSGGTWLISSFDPV
jgi:Mce-associated membrane protein